VKTLTPTQASRAHCKRRVTPTQPARTHCIRVYGVFWFTAMTEASRRQLIQAYVAGVRHGRRK
jgi:hypothetical protein